MAITDLNLNLESNHYQFRKRSQMVFELARGLVRFSLACDHLRRDLDSVIILFIIVNVCFIFMLLIMTIPFWQLNPIF